MIRIEHLTRRFHDLTAVDDVSLSVGEGEILGFLGPNGAGKTTTIRILTGFLPATAGKAEVAGFDVAADSLAVRRRIGYCPENVPLPFDARVDEYLEYRGRLKGLRAAERGRRRDAVLEQCGLTDMRRRIVGQLSRGYRQRVGLADALLADPPVLILDEPTGGLDPGQRRDVLDLVATLRGRRTVMLSSHVLSEVEDVCSRVAIIKRGRIVADGTREELEATVGRRGEVRIGVARDLPRLAAWLGEQGLEVAETSPAGGAAGDGTAGGSLVARVPTDRAPAELLAALMGAGLAVDRFEPLTRSLQEIFFDLTGDRAPPVPHAEAPADGGPPA